ncbi:MAG TPA: hypothetical protein DDW87_14155, partial [Firmicutes bacterium]|nr:hypothetical protein [Bacillota bacterium]
MGNIFSLFDLKGRTAVVTGGSGVLCGEMSRALGRAGANVVVLARGKDAIQAVVDDIRHAGGEAVGLTCDVL